MRHGFCDFAQNDEGALNRYTRNKNAEIINEMGEGGRGKCNKNSRKGGGRLMRDDEFNYEHLKRVMDKEENKSGKQNRRKKSDIVTKMPTILALTVWVILLVVWGVLEQAAPDRIPRWLSFFEVNFDATIAYRTRWDRPLVYVAFMLLVASIGVCATAFVFSKFRMRRKTDKHRGSVFFVGGIALIALIALFIWYIFFL